MAQKDIFSYEVDVKEKQIVAARNAALDLGDGKLALVQSMEGSYGHTVQSIYEAGSSSVYFVHGNPIGNFRYSTLIGTNGWFDGFPMSGACASLRTINIDLLSENEDCDVEVKMNTNLKFEGAILTQVSFTITSGQLQISTTGTFTCAKMLRTK